MRKLILLATLALLVVLFFAFDLHQVLTLAHLKAVSSQLMQQHAEAPLLSAALYFSLYVTVTALSLPGAAVMTLAGGALFGLLPGLLLVSFASSIGATLAFLVSRYLLHDWVQDRFGARLQTLNQGIRRDGGYYLFTLRLVPIFPFFLINLLMGLTPIRAWTFYWVSQVGMLAGTLVYVNAGTQLAGVDSLADILSPTLLLSFALLGLFPVLAKRFARWFTRHRVYARWSKPAHFDRNLIVIGAGAGGLVSAYIAAAVKAKVTLIEADKMGGDCLNTGCVPSKALIKSARVAQQMRQAEQYGLRGVEPTFSFRELMTRVQRIITEVEPHDSVERYTRLGVEVLQGHARLIDPWTVQVTLNDGREQRLTTRSIILATGASPIVPDLPGLQQSDYVTSETLWSRFATLDAPPQRLLVLGGGPIGCELAQSFARLGSQVTLVIRGGRLLPREDAEVAEWLQRALTADGVRVLTEHIPQRVIGDHGTRRMVVTHANQEIELAFDQLLLAVGRAPRLEGYGLDTLGIDTGRTITTNPWLQTRYPNIYAVGDVAGPYQFTHTAAHQAWYATVNALFGRFKLFRANYRVIPWTTFTDPEIARVGLSEQDAHEQGVAYEVTRFALTELDRALTESETSGFIKVLTPPGKDRILGVCIVGPHAGDLLAEFVLAMKHNLGLNKVLGTIHTYPTWAEANKYVAGEWKKAHTPAWALRLLARYHRYRLGRNPDPTER